MKINFKTLIDNDVIESGKLTEIIHEGKTLWKGMSDDLYDLSENYEFVRFDHTKNNTFNEAFYKIEARPLNEAKIETKKSFEDEMEYGLPEDKKYPLYDKAHVLSAIKFFNYCKEPEKQEVLAKAIIEKMEKYGIPFDTIGSENKLREFLPVVKEEVEEHEQQASVEILNNLRKDIQGEYDAIVDYDERAKAAEDAGLTDLANTLRDIRDEEKVHIGELQYELKKLDKPYEKGLEAGAEEVKEEQKELDESESLVEASTSLKKSVEQGGKRLENRLTGITLGRLSKEKRDLVLAIKNMKNPTPEMIATAKQLTDRKGKEVEQEYDEEARKYIKAKNEKNLANQNTGKDNTKMPTITTNSNANVVKPAEQQTNEGNHEETRSTTGTKLDADKSSTKNESYIILPEGKLELK